MGWTAGVRLSAEARVFSTRQRSDRLRPTLPPIQWVPGTIFPRLKRPGREAEHSPPSSAEVKYGGTLPPLPIYFHGIMLN
jgi:hypothetical protein